MAAKKSDIDIGFRLPTEAEWEYACRGRGKNVLYCGGNDIDAMAWYDRNSGNRTHEVGAKRENGIGIYDMSGNVWEWCQDWYGNYDGDQIHNLTGPKAGVRQVLRGGSWFSMARFCRSTDRNWYGYPNRSAYLGFRLVFPAGQ